MADTVIVAATLERFRAVMTAGWDRGRLLLADGKRVAVLVAEHEDDLTIRQRGFLHKAVFPQIAEQVTFPDGTRFEWRVWKEMFRGRFLGDRWVMKREPRWDEKTGRWAMPKRKTPRRERVSTEDLGVKAYSRYIDQVIDTAIVEFGVVFRFLPEERDAVRYTPPARKRAAQPEAETC